MSILIDAGAAGTFVSDGTTLLGSRPPPDDPDPLLPYRFLTVTGGKLDYTHAVLREDEGDVWYLGEVSSAGVWLAQPGMPQRMNWGKPVRVFSGDRFKCGVVWFTVVIIPTTAVWKVEPILHTV